MNFDFKFEFLRYLAPELKIFNVYTSALLCTSSLSVECSSCLLQDSKQLSVESVSSCSLQAVDTPRAAS